MLKGFLLDFTGSHGGLWGSIGFHVVFVWFQALFGDFIGFHT